LLIVVFKASLLLYQHSTHIISPQRGTWRLKVAEKGGSRATKSAFAGSSRSRYTLRLPQPRAGKARDRPRHQPLCWRLYILWGL